MVCKEKIIEVYYSKEFYKESLLFEDKDGAYWSDEISSGYGKFKQGNGMKLDSDMYIKLFEIME